ncbi:MAG TPA: SRPBCC domain-containing protein, partial [Thermoleophilaceae bacterium]|nr:SRPBCC domain-containing protein [Thermoleophilaceae bacterium]
DWLGGDVEMDPVPGGEFHIRFDGDDASERTGFVEEIDHEERRLSFWWRRPEDELATRVQIELEETDEGTIVRVIETSPLATLDLIGIQLPAPRTHGPLALALAHA